MSILSKLGIVTASDRAERQRTLEEEIAIANAQQQEAKKAEKERIAQEQRRARREQERQERAQKIQEYKQKAKEKAQAVGRKTKEYSEKINEVELPKSKSIQRISKAAKKSYRQMSRGTIPRASVPRRRGSSMFEGEYSFVGNLSPNYSSGGFDSLSYLGLDSFHQSKKPKKQKKQNYTKDVLGLW